MNGSANIHNANTRVMTPVSASRQTGVLSCAVLWVNVDMPYAAKQDFIAHAYGGSDG